MFRLIKQYTVLLYILMSFLSFGQMIEDKIIIEYGLRIRPDKLFYSFDEVKSLEFIINSDKIEYFKQLKEGEIKKVNIIEMNQIIKQSILDAETRNKIINCEKIENGYYRDGKEQKYIEAHTRIKVKDKEYCILGKTKIMNILSEEFNLDLEWKKKITGEINIFYGMRRGPHSSVINYNELFEKKITISKDSIRFYSYDGSNKYKLDINKKIEESEYTKIKKLADKTITNEKSEICAILNTSYGHAEKVKVRQLYSKLEVDGGEICAEGISSSGITEILVYLDKKYDLNIEWAKEVFF